MTLSTVQTLPNRVGEGVLTFAAPKLHRYAQSNSTRSTAPIHTAQTFGRALTVAEMNELGALIDAGGCA